MMRIKFNGKELNTQFMTSLDFFKSVSKNENDVWIVNGFATKENVKLSQNDELFCIEKNIMPPKDALDAMMRARHTPKLHDKLKISSVAICGLGGLGSHIAINLARSGLGFLKLIDFDVVEPSNLNRQAYRISDLAKFKTEALKEQIVQINPYIKTEICTLKIDEENLPYLFEDIDIVCEAFDSARAKAMIAQNFHKFYADTILICASGLAGYGDSNSIQTRKIAKNFYVCGDLVNGAKIGNGLMAPRVNICAGHQSNLVLELLANKE
ncbi:thiamine biosynthesis protein ThiF [Campylobacter hepaticus]|uniref:Thiamine biosynthesis protein ThiF n=1 Tax=Campylobacter hepaticus TaxID=1813019 RepID=A0A424Z1Y9_9BACT|nr:thiamine biosynthesis protein ThiF [Campylobacter hepaticus]AXP08459.1 thiamine biosynthesis protein ThiF [Campylobacter hepaticus]MCZ0772291.1 thiamine biosynthesis protein ThiF [Campylobacter hepaticus]MCZ0773759.1 thiamine biosynthesis protein ThiF [Campylobacter hepaticus]MCZ0775010.1 thiamine biosynthesis protein ThiF [Campylobacter hepaticus]MDX2322879.1 thiamine biosynthesis protein ThiF [Campylobacter hepaticus]